MNNQLQLLGAECFIEFGYYPNHTVAFQATRISDGEPWCTATVNYESRYQGSNYTRELSFPAVVIKNYSENTGVYQELIDAGVIDQGPYLSGSGGTVQVGILTAAWQAFAKEQLAKAQ